MCELSVFAIEATTTALYYLELRLGKPPSRHLRRCARSASRPSLAPCAHATLAVEALSEGSRHLTGSRSTTSYGTPRSLSSSGSPHLAYLPSPRNRAIRRRTSATRG